MAMLHPPTIETSSFPTPGQAHRTFHTQVSLHATSGCTSMPVVLTLVCLVSSQLPQALLTPNQGSCYTLQMNLSPTVTCEAGPRGP